MKAMMAASVSASAAMLSRMPTTHNLVAWRAVLTRGTGCFNKGAQIKAPHNGRGVSPAHKLSPALVEQLRKMLQELLHDGLIVPLGGFDAGHWCFNKGALIKAPHNGRGVSYQSTP
jgi:hypothetical protein